MTISLVDVSKYQGPGPNWALAKQHGITAAIVEYKDEDGAENPYFADQCKGAQAAGLGVGFYVFCRDNEPVKPQASDLNDLAGLGATWADLELPGAGADAFRNELAAAVVHEVSSYIPSYMAEPSFGPYPWTTAPAGGAGRFALVQVGPQTVPGFAGDVDVDLWLGDYSQLAAAFRLKSRPNPPPPVEHSAGVVGGAGCSTGGYWLVTDEGRIYCFGGAPFLGSMYGRQLAEPVVSMAAAGPRGYWLFAHDGGVFAFGTAKFSGSVPSLRQIAAQGASSGYVGAGEVAGPGAGDPGLEELDVPVPSQPSEA